MTSAHFVLSLICLINIARETRQSSSTSVHKERRFISANIGENVTLECSYPADQSNLFYWYKQPQGQEPKFIFSHYMNQRETKFHDKNNQSYVSNNKDNTLTLTITNLRLSNLATYFCVKSVHRLEIHFSEAITFVVKEKSSFPKVLIQQSDSEIFHPGDSVTLNCTADTGSSGGEPRVYWFKISEDNHPSLIYTQRDNNYSCGRKSGNLTHTCVYKLRLNNLDQSNAGTYYCTLTVFGRIVFGNGTRLAFKDTQDQENILIAALTLTTILVIVLAYLTHKMYKKNSCESTASVTENISGRTEDLNYAALSFNPANRPHTRRQNECVYSGVNN